MISWSRTLNPACFLVVHVSTGFSKIDLIRSASKPRSTARPAACCEKQIVNLPNVAVLHIFVKTCSKKDEEMTLVGSELSLADDEVPVSLDLHFVEIEVLVENVQR